MLVLLFHAGFPWLSGGYLGVSVFFTLSGFLITSLLLVEQRTTGRVALGAFYARRARRLLPASIVCVVLVVVAHAAGAFRRVEGLRGDVVAAVLQVFNWATLRTGSSYGDLFQGGTSPLEHYWSLAIEEQFYWVWPVALIGLIAAVGRRRLPAAVVALFVVASLAAPVIAQVWGPDAAYWATPARLAEILAGAVLAVLLAAGVQVPARARHAAVPALALIVGLCLVLPSGSGLAYRGALPLFAVMSTVLVASLQVPGPLRTALGWRPFVAMGRVSYGLYLFHWPVFVLLRERGHDLTRPADLALALAITTCVTLASYRLVEMPVRRARWVPLSTLRLAVAASVPVVVAAALMAPAVAPVVAVSGFADEVALVPVESLAPLVTSSTAPGSSVVQSATTSVADGPETVVTLGPPLTRPVRTLLIGDSTSQAITVGLQAWAAANPGTMVVDGRWSPGFTFLDADAIVDDGLREFAADSAERLDAAVTEAVPTLRPDVVVLMDTLVDVADRRWPDGVLAPTDPAFQERLADAYGRVTDDVLAAGVSHVVWVVPPVPVPPGRDGAEPTDRFIAQHRVLGDVVAARAGRGVALVDLDAWLNATGHTGNDWRPDGVHIVEAASTELATQYLGPWLVRRATTP